MLAVWGNNPAPPKYVQVQDHFLSRAEMFQAMADGLAGLDRSRKLPKTVHVVPVFAPIEILPGKVPSGELSASGVAHAAAGFAARLHDASRTPVPHNVIPSMIQVEGKQLVPSQVLRLMAEALVAESPETKLQIKKIEMFSGREELFYKSRLTRDMGGVWTRKPAVLTTAAPSPGAAGQ